MVSLGPHGAECDLVVYNATPWCTRLLFYSQMDRQTEAIALTFTTYTADKWKLSKMAPDVITKRLKMLINKILYSYQKENMYIVEVHPAVNRVDSHYRVNIYMYQAEYSD